MNVDFFLVLKLESWLSKVNVIFLNANLMHNFFILNQIKSRSNVLFGIQKNTQNKIIVFNVFCRTVGPNRSLVFFTCPGTLPTYRKNYFRQSFGNRAGVARPPCKQECKTNCFILLSLTAEKLLFPLKTLSLFKHCKSLKTKSFFQNK